MANTHFLWLIGDAHLRGQNLGLIDPVKGVDITIDGVAGTIERNVFLRGAVSTSLMKVVEIKSATSLTVSIEGSGIGPAPGLPGIALAQTAPIGETLNFDTGATGAINRFVTSQRYGGLGQLVPAMQEATFNTMTPPDGSQGVFWDHRAKLASRVRVLRSTITPASPSPNFVVGDRVSATSGGTFTIIAAIADATYLNLFIARRSGTVAPGDVLTNLTRTASGSVWNDPSAVEQDWGQGAWVPHHMMPNLGGTGSLYEFQPSGDGGGIGVYQPIVRGLWSKWGTDSDPNNQGCRAFAFSSPDHFAVQDDWLAAGVSVQRVQFTDPSPSVGWNAGETVTAASGWSAKVYSYDAANKWLWVYDTNGEVLGAETVTGAASGSIGTSVGAAFGWRMGSASWNKMIESYERSRDFSHPSYKGLHNSQAAKIEGIFLGIWESEMSCWRIGSGAWPWPQVDFIATQWAALIQEIRDYVGYEVPITLFHGDIRSAVAIRLFGIPFAFLVREAMLKLALLPGVTLTSTEGMQPAQTGPLPYTGDMVYLRPLDYYEVGVRAWKAIEYGTITIPPGQFQPLAIVFVGGQSWAVGGIPASWAFGDADPDLFPSIDFPGVNTTVPTVFNFHTKAEEWRVYDVAHCANTFLRSDSGFGFEAPILARFRRRYAEGEELFGEVGLIKCAQNSASVNAASPGAPWTFDPQGSARTAKVASMTVTVIPANASNPKLGRFTAAAGTFTGWVAGEWAMVQGSALGYHGTGGNNSIDWQPHRIRNVAADGAYIELEGSAFVSETRTFTITMGPLAVAPEVERIVSIALEKCVTQLRRIPFVAAILWWNGEGDVTRASEYEGALLRTMQWLENILGLRAKAQAPVAKVIMEMTPNTPANVSDEEILQIIQAQRAVASQLTNAVAIPSPDYPMESAGVFPRTTRFHNGFHTTPQGYMVAGRRADYYLGQLSGIPSHPDGEDITLAVSGSLQILGTGEEPLTVTESLVPATTTTTAPTSSAAPAVIGSSDPVYLALVVEDGTGKSNADSYISLAEFRTMAQQVGNPSEVANASDAQCQVWLRMSAAFGIDYVFGQVWQGKRTNETQRLSWPRMGAGDSRTYTAIKDNVIPTDVKWCQFWYAIALALGIDVLADFDATNEDAARRYATSRSENLGGGLSESFTFGLGVPSRSILFRMHAAAIPFINDDADDTAGMA